MSNRKSIIDTAGFWSVIDRQDENEDDLAHQSTSTRSSLPRIRSNVDPKLFDIFDRMDQQKCFIENHPLFPILVNIVGKCHWATTNPEKAIFLLKKFDQELKIFIHQFENVEFRKQIQNENVGDLIIDVIRVLRIHLYELSEAHELCNLFCQRYTDKLRETFEKALDNHGRIESKQEKSENDFNLNKSRNRDKKRGIFPKSSTSILRHWLFEHLENPYPSDEEKHELAEQTNLNVAQVNNWFINARRRILQPIIDQYDRASSSTFSPMNYFHLKNDDFNLNVQNMI